MAVCHKAIILLPLLFVTCFAKRSFHGFSNNDDDQGSLTHQYNFNGKPSSGSFGGNRNESPADNSEEGNNDSNSYAKKSDFDSSDGGDATGSDSNGDKSEFNSSGSDSNRDKSEFDSAESDSNRDKSEFNSAGSDSNGDKSGFEKGVWPIPDQSGFEGKKPGYEDNDEKKQGLKDKHNGEEKPDFETKFPGFGDNGVDKQGGLKNIGEGKGDFETGYEGVWKIHNENAGVAAMQFQLMPNNKAVWFDTTALGDSAVHLTPAGNCPANFEKGYNDCFAHGIEYDVESGNFRTLKMASDPWCSSGGLAANGDLINTGGFNRGIKAVRIYSPCKNCEFQENPTALSADRWYASNQILEDGTFAVVGGRRAYNYELIPPNSLKFPVKQFGLRFLADTTDPTENNLYPFVFLIPDGNLFVFANNRAIILNPKSGKTLRELPILPGGSRNYPTSGMSALLPIKLTAENTDAVEAEVLVCGGNKPEAFGLVDGKQENQKNFLPALQDCGRISVTKEDAQWEIEEMPSPRTMGDMLLLPTGDILLLNGAKKGTSGWFDADEPNFTPVLYSPRKKNGERFRELAATKIARMYHSSSAVLPEGNILVAGSNPNDKYNLQAKYPTELRVEKFSPPYLDPALEKYRPVIAEENSDKKLKYGNEFEVRFTLDEAPELDASDVKVTMLAPPFTTHGFSQNQRLLVLGLSSVLNQKITAVAPPSGKLAPPGHYILFVVYRGVPSRGMWVQIE